MVFQGFQTGRKNECLVNGEKKPMIISKRCFTMKNALVVNLIEQMESELDKIIDGE